MSQKEINDSCKTVVNVNRLMGQVNVFKPKHGTWDNEKIFTFDNVFGANSKQVDIYNELARPIVEFVLEGYNGIHFTLC